MKLKSTCVCVCVCEMASRVNLVGFGELSRPRYMIVCAALQTYLKFWGFTPRTRSSEELKAFSVRFSLECPLCPAAVGSTAKVATRNGVGGGSMGDTWT